MNESLPSRQRARAHALTRARWLAFALCAAAGCYPTRKPAPAATALAFSVQPSAATAGIAMTPPVQVVVRDGAGNAVTSGPAYTITLAIGNNPGLGTLSSSAATGLSVQTTAGVADFPGLIIDKAGSGYTLVASATGLTGATSATFDIIAPPPPPPPAPPSAPTSVTATPGNALVTVAWTAPAGATSFNLYYDTKTGVTKASVTATKLTGVTSPRDATGLANGTTYFFVVTAVNAGGESSESTEVSAAPVAPAPPPPPVASPVARIAAPPAGRLYHGVMAGGPNGDETEVSPASLDAYQTAAGRSAAWVYFSNEWSRSRAFPASTCGWIRGRGAVPFIRLMLRTTTEQNVAEKTFTLSDISSGTFDRDLEAWGDGAAAYGDPLLVEWGTEMNGRWFPWNGTWYPGGNVAGTLAFKAAFRHIVQTIRARGATNVTWVFHVNDGDDPVDPWNAFENYYPGDDVVDWIAVSSYGAQTPRQADWPIFRASMDAVMPRLSALAKGRPIVVAELGVTGGNPLGSPTAWADQALGDLLGGRWPEIRGFSWWNEGWPNDADPAHNSEMRVQVIRGMSGFFQSHLGGNASVVDRPIILHSGFSVRSDGTMMRGGAPFLPIGFYVSAEGAFPGSTAHLESAAAEIASKGFNFVHISNQGQPNDWQAVYDFAAASGIHVMAEGVGQSVNPGFVDRFANHDANLGWSIGDDVDGSTNLVQLQALYDDTRKRDPNHPCYIAIGGNNVASVLNEPSPPRRADMASMESYPVGDGSIGLVGPDMELIVAYANRTGMTPLGALQSYNKAVPPNPPEQPSFAQFRNMTYQALVAGIKGFVYYTYDLNGVPQGTTNPDLWGHAHELPAEIAMISPWILGGTRSTHHLVDVPPDPAGPVYGVAGATWERDGRVLGIVVNATGAEQNASLPLPANAGSSLTPAFPGGPSAMTISSGALSGKVAAFEVQVYWIDH